jgi:hypothetical protein
MVFGREDSDDDEAQLLLSKSSSDAIERSKRSIIETAQLGEEVLRSLQGDTEKIRNVKNKQDRLRTEFGNAERNLAKIERHKLFEYVIVCFALCLVVFGLVFVLLKALLTGKK